MTVVVPSLCLRKCPITISGANVLESGIYAVYLNGSGTDPSYGGWGGSICPNEALPDEYFALAQSDGQDICFTSDSAGLNQLPMEFFNEGGYYDDC